MKLYPAQVGHVTVLIIKRNKQRREKKERKKNKNKNNPKKTNKKTAFLNLATEKTKAE